MGEKKGWQGGNKRFILEQKSEGSKNDVFKKKLISLFKK